MYAHNTNEKRCENKKKVETASVETTSRIVNKEISGFEILDFRFLRAVLEKVIEGVYDLLNVEFMNLEFMKLEFMVFTVVYFWQT